MKTFLIGTIITGLSLSVAYTFLPDPLTVSVARDGFDCEILRVSREITAGKSPDFVSLQKQEKNDGNNMILRAMGEYSRLGRSSAPTEVMVAHGIVHDEMYRQGAWSS